MINRKLSLFILVAIISLSGCGTRIDPNRSDINEIQRRNMVRWDLKEAGIKNPKVLEAMKEVPRHLFLNKQDRAQAYEDVDLPINQFLSTPRPYIVAKTIELLDLQGDEKVLEVGTGLGYQSALLGELAKEVYTIEIVPNVGKKAAAILDQLNYKNIHCRIGDGYKGWPEVEPFDAILVMASAKAVPGPLLNQLKNGGRLVIPIDAPKGQKLVLYRKRKNGNLKQEDIMPINLKPMEGRAAGRYW